MDALKGLFTYRNFDHFIQMWAWKNKFLREYEDFTYIAEKIAAGLIDQNIQYAEMLFSPSLFTGSGLEVQLITEAIRQGLSRVEEIEVRLIADLVRDYGPESEMVTLELLREVQELGVVGVGLGGTEHEYPAVSFEKVFDQARKIGFRTNAHAGEASGAESVWVAIRFLKVDRIGHATKANTDRRLVEYFLEHKVHLEMCPLSNVRTGVIKKLEQHPIKEFFDEGLLVAVNMDDPGMFGNSLAEEYRCLVEQLGFSKEMIVKLVYMGIEASWLGEDRKLELLEDFRNEITLLDITD